MEVFDFNLSIFVFVDYLLEHIRLSLVDRMIGMSR